MVFWPRFDSWQIHWVQLIHGLLQWSFLWTMNYIFNAWQNQHINSLICYIRAVAIKETRWNLLNLPLLI